MCERGKRGRGEEELGLYGEGFKEGGGITGGSGIGGDVVTVFTQE
jgi:hypothetical protein